MEYQSKTISGEEYFSSKDEMAEQYSSLIVKDEKKEQKKEGAKGERKKIVVIE